MIRAGNMTNVIIVLHQTRSFEMTRGKKKSSCLTEKDTDRFETQSGEGRTGGPDCGQDQALMKSQDRSEE